MRALQLSLPAAKHQAASPGSATLTLYFPGSSTMQWAAVTITKVPWGSCAEVCTNQAVQSAPAIDTRQIEALRGRTSNGGLSVQTALDGLSVARGRTRSLTWLVFFAGVVPVGSRRVRVDLVARPTTGAGPARPLSPGGTAVQN